MEPMIVILVFLGFVVFIVLVMTWTFRRSATLVARWAGRNGFEVVGKSWLMLRFASMLRALWAPTLSERPPAIHGLRFGGRAFWWRKSQQHMVYYVTVRDAEGRIRRAYIRCGSWFLGLFSDHVTVVWDD